jgi:hypothetical protein
MTGIINYLAEDVPKDVLCAWRSGEGTHVSVILAGLSLHVLGIYDPKRDMSLFIPCTLILGQFIQIALNLHATTS